MCVSTVIIMIFIMLKVNYTAGEHIELRLTVKHGSCKIEQKMDGVNVKSHMM